MQHEHQKGADLTDLQLSRDFLPFFRPDIREEEIAEVVDALRNGWLTTGPKTRRFEQDFARYMGSDVETVAVNSATAGLHLALEAAGIGPGDEVITTTYTFTATAEVIRYLGAHPVFVDVDDKTLNLQAQAVEEAITPRTRAVIPVHFAGLACDMAAILRIAEQRNLMIIEDAAHALPATAGGRLIGTLNSDATVFSFYATKTLPVGEGGMLVSRRRELAARARVMRLHGIDRDAYDRYTSDEPAWFYRVVAPGFKYNMTDIAAAIGVHQLRRLGILHLKREQMARRYSEALRDLCVQLPANPPEGDIHAWHLYVIRLTSDAPVSRDEFIRQLTAAGIGTSVHFIPLHLHAYWRDTYHLQPGDFPKATRAYHQCISLPLYTAMTEADQDRVIRSVRAILTSGRRNFVGQNRPAAVEAC
jgi:dTDP-4-amino-4,6-dideoxygalactose transaminase